MQAFADREKRSNAQLIFLADLHWRDTGIFASLVVVLVFAAAPPRARYYCGKACLNQDLVPLQLESSGYVQKDADRTCDTFKTHHIAAPARARPACVWSLESDARVVCIY